MSRSKNITTNYKDFLILGDIAIVNPYSIIAIEKTKREDLIYVHLKGQVDFLEVEGCKFTEALDALHKFRSE